MKLLYVLQTILHITILQSIHLTEGYTSCNRCKFFLQQKGLPESFGKCMLYPRIDQYFLVRGLMEKTTDYSYCSTARNIESLCGEKARHYEEI